MNLLAEIYNKLVLNESVNVNSITDSIKNRYQATINYEGDPEHGIAPGIRVIQAYAYGLTKAGNPVIRAYQPYGDTVSTVPAWKFFRLDRIKSWKPSYAKTTVPAPKFNPDGDKSMSIVYTIADFSHDSVYADTNVTGPRGLKVIGKVDNIDKLIADKNKEREQNKKYQKYTPAPKVLSKNTNIKEPEIKNLSQSNQDSIPEPDVKNTIPKKDEADFATQDNQAPSNAPSLTPSLTPSNTSTEKSNDDMIKTKGDEQLEKMKDLSRRMDNARKLDLSKIPRR